MAQWIFPILPRWSAGLLAVLLLGGWKVSSALEDPSPFQIVWVVIGEASSASDTNPARAGRQLFMASDLLSKNLDQVKIEQVDVRPVVSRLALGQRLCVTDMNIRALGPDKHLVAAAPLSISVRQDHKHALGLRRTRRNICLQPTEAGEYPVRLTSMLPARDGTMRGAQVFIRVGGQHKTNDPEISGIP